MTQVINTINVKEQIKSKSVRCAAARRFMAYDKVSKLSVSVDDPWLDGSEWHICWRVKEDKLRAAGFFFFPQTDIKGMSKEDAFKFAFEVMRTGNIHKFMQYHSEKEMRHIDVPVITSDSIIT